MAQKNHVNPIDVLKSGIATVLSLRQRAAELIDPRSIDNAAADLTIATASTVVQIEESLSVLKSELRAEIEAMRKLNAELRAIRDKHIEVLKAQSGDPAEDHAQQH